MKTEEVRQYLSKLRIIYVALAIGQLIFMALSAFMVNNSGPLVPDLEPINYVALAFAVGVLLVHKGLMDKFNKKAREKKVLLEKLEAYQSTFIIGCALIEGSNFLNTIAYLLTGHWLGLVLFAGLMLFFMRLKPTPVRIAEDLELSREEASYLA
ncbi:hypothetical protein R9C00_11640 [Flammeovirgaceae bacterium SG7u.111]|nr:hypothetical protein [Flammeovirgaceae bacterium SG7u.132]WPO38105.1 hypothetical protein R9C00_11640 [Flammeovirgaceae bacterium SG7u.111]